jgi:tRNA(Ile)-lysidine synthase
MTTMTNKSLRSAEAFLAALPREGASAPVLAAVSGGLDSMCLLHFLKERGGALGFTVTAAHFNHRLRGAEADRDEEFVRSWCAANDVPFVSGSGDVRGCAKQRGLSLEEAGRELRYAFLRRTAAELNCQWIMTAHHADDNAETMLLNLLRGTGRAGLTGIPPVRDGVCRPFLELTRADLSGYAARYAIPHVEDATNRSDEAARNVLRHQVMPVLRTLNPRAAENMSRTARILREEETVLECAASDLLASAAECGDGAREIPAETLRTAPETLASRAVLTLLAQAGGHKKDLSAAHAAEIMELVQTGHGEVSLPYGLRAEICGEALRIERTPPVPEPRLLTAGKTVAFGAWLVSCGTRRENSMAVRRTRELLYVTAWRPDDRMTLSGSRGSRSFKRLCADAGLSTAERDGLPVLRIGRLPAAAPGIGVDMQFEPCSEAETVWLTFQKNNTEENNNEK